MILLVRPEFPAHSLKDFISLARSKSGELTAGYGSAGSQVSIAKLKAGGGFAAVDVPYKGVPLAVTDVLAARSRSPSPTLPSASRRSRAAS